jgi:hypothetical protein
MYSIVAHDPTTNSKNILSVADFFNSNHSSYSINKYLISIKHTLLKVSGTKSILPSIIVTDHSFALMNSVVQTFDNCSLLEYLHYVFELLHNETSKKTIESVLPCKLQICSTHFLKIIIKNVKEAKVQKTIQNLFIFVFSFLQNSTCIKDFDRNLLHIYNIFMQPRINEDFSNSYNFLKVKIMFVFI